MMNDELEKPPDLSERTNVFALRVIKMFSALPKTEVARVLGKKGAPLRHLCRSQLP